MLDKAIREKHHSKRRSSCKKRGRLYGAVETQRQRMASAEAAEQGKQQRRPAVLDQGENFRFYSKYKRRT